MINVSNIVLPHPNPPLARGGELISAIKGGKEVIKITGEDLSNNLFK
jgi:hypothetical protein